MFVIRNKSAKYSPLSVITTKTKQCRLLPVMSSASTKIPIKHASMYISFHLSITMGLLDKQNWLTDKSENKTCLLSNDKTIVSVHVNILIVWWVRAKIFHLPFYFIALRTFCLLTSHSNLYKNNLWLFDRVSFFGKFIFCIL